MSRPPPSSQKHQHPLFIERRDDHLMHRPAGVGRRFEHQPLLLPRAAIGTSSPSGNVAGRRTSPTPHPRQLARLIPSVRSRVFECDLSLESSTPFGGFGPRSLFEPRIGWPTPRQPPTPVQQSETLLGNGLGGHVLVQPRCRRGRLVQPGRNPATATGLRARSTRHTPSSRPIASTWPWISLCWTLPDKALRWIKHHMSHCRPKVLCLGLIFRENGVVRGMTWDQAPCDGKRRARASRAPFPHDEDFFRPFVGIASPPEWTLLFFRLAPARRLGPRGCSLRVSASDSAAVRGWPSCCFILTMRSRSPAARSNSSDSAAASISASRARR